MKVKLVLLTSLAFITFLFMFIASLNCFDYSIEEVSRARRLNTSEDIKITINSNELFRKEVISSVTSYKPNRKFLGFKTKVHQELSENKYTKNVMYGSDHHIIPNSLIRTYFYKALNVLATKSIREKEIFAEALSRFASQDRKDEHVVGKNNDDIFKTLIVAIVWNQGNLIPGPVTERRKNDPGAAFDSDTFGEIEDLYQKNMICKSLDSLKRADLTEFLHHWTVLVNNLYYTEIRWTTWPGNWYTVENFIKGKNSC